MHSVCDFILYTDKCIGFDIHATPGRQAPALYRAKDWFRELQDCASSPDDYLEVCNFSEDENLPAYLSILAEQKENRLHCGVYEGAPFHQIAKILLMWSISFVRLYMNGRRAGKNRPKLTEPRMKHCE